MSLKSLINALLNLVKRAAFPSNTVINVSYTGGDVGDWGTFFSYMPTVDGYLRVQATAKADSSILQIYSGNFGQSIIFPWATGGMVLTVPCTKGLNVNCMGNDLTITSIDFLPSLGSNN